MKKISVFIFVLLCIISCRSENDKNETSTSENLIVGTWKMENNIVLSGKDKSTVLKEYLPDDCKKKATFEFTENGKYVVNDYNYINNDCKLQTATQNYVYDMKINLITIEGISAEMLELTNKKLVMLVPDHYDYNNDGVDDYLKYIFYK